MTDPLVFDNIHRAFDERQVLRGLSFRARPGEIYALLGRNGSGKTTAIRIALGFLAPMAGRVAILGADSQQLTGAVRERIGFVSEGHRMEELRTIRRTLDFEAATRTRFDRAYAEQWVRRLELNPKQRVVELSRGQRAQFSLTLALAGRPDLLVFDDPALGLDPVTRRELIEVMIDLLAGGGVTVLMTSHAMVDVERLADRIGILHRGSLIVDATREELRRRVDRRFLTDPGSRPPQLPGLLSWRRAHGGFELTFLDADDEALVAQVGAQLSEPQPATLEDLFVDLTSEREALLTAPPLVEASP